MEPNPLRILQQEHWADAELRRDLRCLQSLVANEVELATLYERIDESLSDEPRKSESGVRSLPQNLPERHSGTDTPTKLARLRTPQSFAAKRRVFATAVVWAASSIAMAAGISLWVDASRSTESDAALCITAAPETLEHASFGDDTKNAQGCGTRAPANRGFGANRAVQRALVAPGEAERPVAEKPSIEKVELGETRQRAPEPPRDFVLKGYPWANGVREAPAPAPENVVLEEEPPATKTSARTHRPGVPAEPPVGEKLPPGEKPPPGEKTAGGATPPNPLEPAPSSPTARAACGLLSLNSIPYSRVVVDGRPLGDTPRVGVPVSPGLHSIVFIHPEHGRKIKHVEVAAGATALVVVTFP